MKRLPERGAYDQETVYQILDEALICHVGFAIEQQPFVIPTIHARRDNTLLLHGATTSRLLNHLQAANSICATTTLLDGLVIARVGFCDKFDQLSFGCSVWHRAPARQSRRKIRGAARFDEPAHAGTLGGRTPTDRKRNESDDDCGRSPIESATAKIRVGPPKDDAEDYNLDLWAGVLPIAQTFQTPVEDPKLKAGIPFPEYLRGYQRGRNRIFQ